MAKELNDSAEPLLIVFPSKGDYHDPLPGRSPKPVIDVTPELRNELVSQVEAVEAAFSEIFTDNPGLPVVAVINLREKAQAKSHRPNEVFNEKTCPVIGTNNAGELYVSVTPTGLKRVKARLLSEGKNATASVSAIEDIHAFRVAEDSDSPDIKTLAEAQKIGVRLFNHGSPQRNAKVDAAFKAIAKKHDIVTKPIHYTESTIVYSLPNASEAALREIDKFAGTQGFGIVPEYELVRTQAMPVRTLQATDMPPPRVGISYGLVGQIDSGTDPRNAAVQKWVVKRDETRVPRGDQDNTHGTFVAALMINGRALNHGNTDFPSVSSKIVDVVAFPKTGRIDVDDLLDAIDHSLLTYPEVRVWNLSLAKSGDYRHLHDISPLGAALDERAKKFGVLFILPTGNIREGKLRLWPPPQQGFEKIDRMPPPGDSVRGLTVGGIAHAVVANSCVKVGEPSPFSSRGPGLGAMPKPEVAHFAGNTDSTGNYAQSGILSVDCSGNLAEAVGVSFAVPSISTIAANVFSELSADNMNVSPTLVKGLIVHSAFVRNGPMTAERIEYQGAGVPGDIGHVLNCRQSSATMVFQVPVDRRSFAKHPFPIPECLINAKGKLRCEVFMTLLYDPPLEAQYSLEYCRTDVTASLGTLEIDDEGNEFHNCQVPPCPRGLSKRYEAGIAKLGYSWSPLKFYYRSFTKFEAGDRNWRLLLDRTDRAEYNALDPQLTYLMLTIRTLVGDQPQEIHRSLVESMRAFGWEFRNIETRTKVGVQRHRT